MRLQGRTNSQTATAFGRTLLLFLIAFLAVPLTWAGPPVESRAGEEMSKQQVRVDTLVVTTTKADWEKLAEQLGESPWPGRQFGYTVRQGKISQIKQAISKSDQSKILSAPRLVTVSGRRAVLKAGSEIDIIVPGGAVSSKTEKRFIGTTIEVEPQVLDSGKIRCLFKFKHSKISDQAAAVDVNGVTVPGLNVVHLALVWENEPGEGMVFAMKSSQDADKVTIVAVEVGGPIAPQEVAARPETKPLSRQKRQ